MAISWNIDPQMGDLGVIEFNNLDFVPRRVYWITNFVPGVKRGFHAHKTLRQLMFVARGFVELELKTGRESEHHVIYSSSSPLRVNPGVWREFGSSDPSTVLVVLCDQPFDDSDYIRNFDEYLSWFRLKNEN